MPGFLAWLHPRHPLPGDLAGASTAEARAAPDGTWGLAGLHSHSEAGPVAAISGHPVWRDSDLAGVAAARGDDAALIQAYARHGDGLLDRLGGAFSLVVLEPARGRLLAAIDRTGRMPLYYAIVGDGVAVATGTGRLLEHPEVERTIDPQAIHDYLHFHMIPAPATVFAGMRKLQAAERLQLEGGRVTVDHYWLPAFDEARGATGNLRQEVYDSLERAVDRHLVPNTGSFLSGGLDSSTVTGLHARLRPDQAHAFSIGFEAEGYDEIPFARTAARHFGVPLDEYYVTPGDVADAVQDVAVAFDEPFGNSSALPALFCARMAREHGIDRLLAGDGGDELFGGNARYAKQQVFELYARLPASLRRGLLEPVLATPAGRLPLARKARRYVEQANVPLPDRMQQYSFLQQMDPGDMLTPELRAATDADRPMQHLRELYHRPEDASALNRMLYLDWQVTLADSDLRKVSTMCALAGVEVVYPMLDDDVLELACRVPSRKKLKRGRLRHFYKEAFRGFLPDSILDKRKHGFGLPFGVWLRDSPALHELARDSLHTLRGRGWLRDDFLDRLFERHLQAHPAYWGELVWILMTLAIWLNNAPGRSPFASHRPRERPADAQREGGRGAPDRNPAHRRA